MDMDDLDLFVEAAESVFKEIGFAISVKDNSGDDKSMEILASVGITGDISGFLMLKSNISSAENFIAKMLTNLGMDPEENDNFGRFHKEALGEVLNQISGRGMILLEEKGINCDITPPTLIIGSNIFSKPAEAKYVLNKSLTGDYGMFTLYAGIK